MRAGDTLLSVDGEDIQGLTVEEITPRIKGKVGSEVVLGPYGLISASSPPTTSPSPLFIHAIA